MTRYAMLMVTMVFGAGCAHQGLSKALPAIITAPIIAPIMILEARRNDDEAFLERARRNQEPLPPVDAQSSKKAQMTLNQALNQGVAEEGLYWENENDKENGYAAGGVTVLREVESDDQLTCREVLIETVVERRWSHQRVRTYCWDGKEWTAGP